MLNAALLIARKDLRLMAGGAGLVQTLLLGLLLIFVFSLARQPGELIPPRTAGVVFWLASAFCLVLVGNMCHALEEASGVRLGLLLAPVPPQAVWLGKTLAILLVLALAQAVFLPASVVFLGQTVQGIGWGIGWRAMGCLILIDFGLAALGALLGALAQGRSARESLLSLFLFPLILPVLLAGIRLGDAVFGPPVFGQTGAPAPDGDWIGLVAAFDALFAAAGLVLFPFVYTGEE